MRSAIYSLIVENTSGVLSHISGLFSRRGYNIDSFSAGVTADPRFTRITITSSGDDEILEQIEKQLQKLEDVVEVRELKPNDSVTRELILIKIRVSEKERSEILSVANIFRAKIIDVSNDSMIIELTGTQSKLDAFVGLIKEYEILQLARTGACGLLRGSADANL